MFEINLENYNNIEKCGVATCNEECNSCGYATIPNIIKFGLCVSRHDIPDVENYIFDIEINPTNTLNLEFIACSKLKKYKKSELHLYVTGLTVALVAVLNAARRCEINVTLYHYNNVTKKYYAQSVY